MKVNKYFDLKELVPRDVYEEYGEESIKFLDPLMIHALENVREILGVPLVCNNWALGGLRNYCGYRPKDVNIGAKNSMHKQGRAFDLVSRKMSAKDMRRILEERQYELVYPIRVEKWEGNGEISWLHIDNGDTKGNQIYFFHA